MRAFQKVLSLKNPIRMSSITNCSNLEIKKPIPNAAPYFLVDIGANLHNHAFKPAEISDIIDRSKASGVGKIMVTGTCISSSKKALELVQQYPDYLFCTAGLHPHDAKHFDANTLDEIRLLCQKSECVAVGECGLDFNRNFSPPDQQLGAFEAQVGLACELQKPLFVHEREAHNDLLRILTKKRSQPLPLTVVHCFTGTVAEMQSYLDAGFYIGLTGFLWKDKLPDGVQYALKNKLLPLDRLLLETDSPYMFPNVKAKSLQKQGITQKISEHANAFLKQFCNFDRNEPCSLAATCELIAAFMNVDAAEVAQHATSNAIKVFGLRH